MAFRRQIGTLIAKNFKILLYRNGFATVVRALILPVVLAVVLSYVRNFYVVPATFGIGDQHTVKSLERALALASETDHDRVAFVNNGLQGGDIDRVINAVANIVTNAGKKVVRISDPSDLALVCQSSLRGVSPCYGAVVFNSSPREGNGGIWNYTLRGDGSLGIGKIDVTKSTNDAEVYSLPLQRVVDTAIANVTTAIAFPEFTIEYPFTSITQEERAQRIREKYMAAITNYLGVAFIAVLVGVCYHMVGFMASERETGMSQLIDAMMATEHMWEAQVARLWSYHVAFSLVYLPGWIISAVVLGTQVFVTTNTGIVLGFFVLSGLALTSLSILGAVFFKKAQVSGVMCTMTFCLMGVFAQILTAPKTAPVQALSVLFTPCNFVYFITYLARFQQQPAPADLVKIGPGSPWRVSGFTLLYFLAGQILVYPLIGAIIEREIHGTTTSGRTILRHSRGINGAPDTAVRLEGFTKIYKPSPFRKLLSFVSKPREAVLAVNGLTLTAARGQILGLLGANGSGKSTTLDSIAGLGKLTRGKITIDGTGGLGIAPQKNVMWDELTVREHIEIFNCLKTPDKPASAEEIDELIRKVDLVPKAQSLSKTLSGGQKRKLQLGMMLTGGSAVCCVDEVSSGIDPLSRRKVWDILLAERGRRTIILTTHFLDEADLLSDRIAILSKGTLKAEGSSAELKDRLGAGYRIHVFKARDSRDPPQVPGVMQKTAFDVVTYMARSSAEAAEVIKTLEGAGIHDYKYSGPTIEDVFLQVSEEVKEEEESSKAVAGRFKTEMVSDGEANNNREGLRLLSGRRIGYLEQAKVLFLKRCTILKYNWFPSAAAFAVPIITAILVVFFVRGQPPIGCNPKEQGQLDSQFGYDAFNYSDLLNNVSLVGGPRSRFNTNLLSQLFAPVLQNQLGNESSLMNLHLVDTFEEFNSYVVKNRLNITPAGWWLGDDETWPAVAYRADNADVFTAFFGQNALDIMLTNISIAAIYMPLEVPWAPNTGNSLQLLIYTGLILVTYPAFFGLYPNIERRYQVRALQYSNGVRSVPLWLAHAAFDFAIVLASMVILTIIFAALARVWYHLEYLFLIFTLYGLTAILLSYVVSLFCQNQLSTFALAAGMQAVGFLAYLIGYLCVYTYAAIDSIDHGLRLVHFIIAAFLPIGSVMHTMFTVLNLFNSACGNDGELARNPGSWYIFGAPICYLIVQSLLLFGFLIWYDSGAGMGLIRRVTDRKRKPIQMDEEDATMVDAEASNNVTAAMSEAKWQGGGGLSVRHLTKTFGKNTAVDNVSFNIKHDEVFALLGPNGAGKSTTISLIRGDIQPSRRNGGDVVIENTSIVRHRAAARSNLGVCPQFDCIDGMTVVDHLRFYAKIRGVSDVEHNVRAVMHAVGLEHFANRLAHALSGGNKRKLSLGIALMGNPSVVLLDEPSSGLDAAAKRIMWRTLATIGKGRSILLTTHSMEEADALANRVGFLAKRMLAKGSIDDLRQQFGDTLHVHLVSRTAPHSTPVEMDLLRKWVLSTYPGADIDEQTYHGQMRFSVPATAVMSAGGILSYYGAISSSDSKQRSAVGQLICDLEEHKRELGIEYYSVTPTTLDQVFLAIVGANNVREENYDSSNDGVAGDGAGDGVREFKPS